MTETGSARYIDLDQLCEGLFVELEIDWLEHPFPLNCFRIKSSAQIEKLKTLGIKRILYDPARSKCAPLPLKAHPVPPGAHPESDESGHVQETVPAEPHTLEQKKVALLEKVAAKHQALDACEKKFRSAAKTFSSVNNNLYAQPAESIERAGKLVDSIIESTLTEREVSLTLMNNKFASREVYEHALNVTVLGLVVGQQVGLEGEELRLLGLGCLFHDIAKSEIPPKIINKAPPLTSAEQKLIKAHVNRGVAIGSKLGMAAEILKIIQQHHERVDGSGYPKRLKEADICDAAKIICVVNDFDNYCNPPNQLTALTPHEALQRMYVRHMKEYSPLIASQFIRCMGIYPPGTLVELSNDTQGLVLSVNTAKPLKPTIMIYDGRIPRRDAIILDLSEEQEVAITGALRRDALSLEAAAYLNPRNRISYFTQGR